MRMPQTGVAAALIAGTPRARCLCCCTRPSAPTSNENAAPRAAAGASMAACELLNCTIAQRQRNAQTMEALIMMAAKDVSHPNSWLYVSVSIGTGADMAISSAANVLVATPAYCCMTATHTAPNARETPNRHPSSAVTSATYAAGMRMSSTIPSASSVRGALAATS